MAAHTPTEAPIENDAPPKVPVIDTDAHLGPCSAMALSRPAKSASNQYFGSNSFTEYLPERWRAYVADIGLRQQFDGTQMPPHREFAHRTDTVLPGGGFPGSDVAFAQEQLLDLYDMSGVILNDNGATAFARGDNNYPHQLAIDYARAANEFHRGWLHADDRLYGSIIVPIEDAVAAVNEIQRCMESGERYVQVLVGLRNQRPLGHPRYWPVLEACAHYDIPVGFHVMAHTQATPCGLTNYYFEYHTDFALSNFPLVASLIFEGCFDRFPNLKIALLEQGWSWVPQFGWRMDGAWRKLKLEVPHLERKPSDYLREHFWYSTQPIEEPEHAEWFDDVWGLMESHGMADKVMWSSDYPHWDFDEPAALPMTMPPESRRKVLGENASKLYKIPLRQGTGVPAIAEARP